ncbi:MAG: Gfo/Idh/MocA family oxidoreductase [Victivallaceae bacterium]|nr:Gfo/Idh/MocA family oxidoreductase [Victivallaceae bacterium]
MDCKKINVAVIACGARSRGVVANLLRDSKRNVSVLTCYDPDRAVAKRAVGEWNSPETKICRSSAEAINFPGIDWVMVFSPNAYHKQHILAGFAAGKNVFSEKPLATKIADCQKIFEAHQKSGVLFATGFVLRYAPIYRKVKALLDSGKFGYLLAVDANENIAPEHGAYIMQNWRRLTKYAGPHILEKCTHDLDLLNWFVGTLPSRVASFGSRRFFVPENEKLMEKYGRSTFEKWDDPHKLPSPFTSDKDLKDNQVAIIEYRNGVHVQFECTMSNVIPERRMMFSCSEGNIIAELYSGKLVCRRLGEPATEVYDFLGDGHGGGDNYIMKELYENVMCKGEKPACSGNEGLESAVLSLAIDKAANLGRVVDLEPVWKSMNR